MRTKIAVVSLSDNIVSTDSPWCELLKRKELVWYELVRVVCNIESINYLNSTLWDAVRHFSDDNTFEHFWKNKNYHDAGWLLLAFLDKLLKEKHELQACTNKQKLSKEGKPSLP